MVSEELSRSEYEIGWSYAVDDDGDDTDNENKNQSSRVMDVLYIPSCVPKDV